MNEVEYFFRRLAIVVAIALQFSAYLVEKGFKIIAVGNDEQFLDGNFEKTDEIEKDKIILRACAKGFPDQNNNRIEVDGKYYIPNN